MERAEKSTRRLWVVQVRKKKSAGIKSRSTGPLRALTLVRFRERLWFWLNATKFHIALLVDIELQDGIFWRKTN